MDKISGIFKSAGTKLIVILGLAGMALILFSDFIIPDKEAVKQEARFGRRAYRLRKLR